MAVVVTISLFSKESTDSTTNLVADRLKLDPSETYRVKTLSREVLSSLLPNYSTWICDGTVTHLMVNMFTN
jgi:hypothetical protein